MGTVGYCRVLRRYCGVLWYTVGIPRGTVWYCGVLYVTAGYCWLLLGTGEYWVVLGCTPVLIVSSSILQYPTEPHIFASVKYSHLSNGIAVNWFTC